MTKRWLHLLMLLVLSITLFVSSSPEHSHAKPAVDTNPKRSSSAITLSPGGGTLVTVNPDSNTITIIDTATNTAQIEIPVGSDPRTIAIDSDGDCVYVANRLSNNISVVDIENQTVTTNIPVGVRPYGVVLSPDDRYLYVAEQASHQLNVIDTDTFKSVAQINVPELPSGLAISADGRRLYITHLLSGEITVVYLSLNSTFLPFIGHEITLKRKISLRPTHSNTSIHKPLSPHPDPQTNSSSVSPTTDTIRLWSDSNLVQSFVISPDGLTGYVPHTRSNTNNQALTFDTTVFPLVSLIDLSKDTHLIGQQYDLGTLDPPGVGIPFDAVVTPDGKELWVLNAASNDISVINLDTRRLAAHIEVQDNPRGIVLTSDGLTAYVNNTLAGTVSVINTVSYTVTETIPVTQIPLPPILLTGKRLFHSTDDPRISNAQWIACNTCHFEGEHDGRTWTFGWSGPRNTTNLLGMIETYPLRWSGEWDESADSEFVVRKENFGSGLIDGDVNCSLNPVDCVNHPPNQGRSPELDALAAFMDSLQMPLSPDHINGEPLTASELRGEAIFDDPALGCITCHPPPLYTDKLMHDVGTSTEDEKIGPAYDTPTLNGLYNSAPYFHDGSAETLYETLTFPSPESEHDVTSILTVAEIQDLIAYLLALPFNHDQ
jgi:YVTN family beta-propeller protein